jgi:hypothetical protein
VDLDVSLASIAAYGAPGALDRLKEHLDPTWVEDALTWSGTTSIRRRRLPADQVVWLVIGMALYRNEPIEHIVDMLDLALPDKKDTLVAKSAIAQARRRLTEEPLASMRKNGEVCRSTDSTARRSACPIHPRIALPLAEPMQAHHAARAAIRWCEQWPSWRCDHT